jgi:hypothetical protein
MVPVEIIDFGSRKRQQFHGYDLRGAEIFSDLVAGVMSHTTHERIGRVRDVLCSQDGRPQYVVVDLELAGWERVVLLPARRAYVHPHSRKLFASGLTRAQVEQMPEYRIEFVESYN